MLRRKPLQKRSGLRGGGGLRLQRRARINPIGRVGRYRRDRKQKWIEDFPPVDGWYEHCVLCGYPVNVEKMALEHRFPKGSTPKAIAEADENLGPSHPPCNDEKGSKHIPWKYPSPSSPPGMI